MRIVAGALLFMFACSCQSNTGSFKVTAIKNQSLDYSCGKGGCSFFDKDSKSEIFSTYDTIGYISINDSVIVLRLMPSRSAKVERYGSDQFEVDVKKTVDLEGSDYDYSAIVTIRKKNGASVTKKAFASCGL